MRDHIYYNGIQYDLIDSIFEKYENFSTREKKDIINDMNISDGQYLYVSINKSGYKILKKTDRYKRKKIYISKDWIDGHKSKLEEIAQNHKKNASLQACHVRYDMDHDYLSKVKQDQILPPKSQHYIYLVTGPITAAIKVGIWSNNLFTLASRYKSVYGNAIELLVFDVHSAREKESIEKEFIAYFKNNNICGELFEKEGYACYKNFLQKKTVKNGFMWNREKTLLEGKKHGTMGLPILPPRIDIEEKYQFSFDDIHYPLTIRGTGYSDTTFFKASDIGNICKLKKMRYVTKYKRGVDYVFFQNKDAHGNKDNKSNNNVSLYLTTSGLYMLLGRIHDRSQIHTVLTLWISNNIIKKQ